MKTQEPKLIAEVENALSGDLEIVKNTDGTFSIYSRENREKEKIARHINMSNPESIINALCHYLQAEAYARVKAEKKCQNNDQQ